MVDLIFGHFGVQSHWHIKLTITCQDHTLSFSCRQIPVASVCWPSWALRLWALYTGLWCTQSSRVYLEEQTCWLRGSCVQHAEMSRSSDRAGLLSHLPWAQVPLSTSSRTLAIVTVLYCTHLVDIKCYLILALIYFSQWLRRMSIFSQGN